jgi:hypothetical protein
MLPTIGGEYCVGGQELPFRFDELLQVRRTNLLLSFIR